MLTQFIEQEDTLQQAKSKMTKLEKEKSKLQIQIKELTAELQMVNNLDEAPTNLQLSFTKFGQYNFWTWTNNGCYTRDGFENVAEFDRYYCYWQDSVFILL